MQLGVYVLLAASVCAGIVSAQTPTGTPTTESAAEPFHPSATDGSTNQPDAAPAPLSPPTPLTPVEKRDQEIRRYDPLDRGTEGEAKSKDKVKANRDVKKRLDEDRVPTPGSIAASEKDQQEAAERSGPHVEDDPSAPAQEYTGPAVLSRMYTINRPLIPQSVTWEESFGVSNVYDTGITKPVRADGSSGNEPTRLIGNEVRWSLAGRHRFRHDEFGFSYQGDVSRYSGFNGYDGANQSLGVDYRHMLSHHLSLNVSGGGSIFSQNYILEGQMAGPDSIADVNIGGSPNIELYDTGIKQFTSQADLTWQKTSRLSFNLGTTYFGITRNSPDLLGVTGEQARSDVTYRLTRRTTIGTYYSFSHYLFPHGFGTSDTNSVGLIYSYALSRTAQIRFRGGISRVETLGLQTVQIDPAIAALLGESFGVIDSYNKLRTSEYSVQFVEDFRRGSTLSFAYARGISPGNGVFQTSQQKSVSGTFRMRVLRAYAFTTSIGRDTLQSVGGILGNYDSAYARVSLDRKYRAGIGLNFTVDYRYFDVLNFGSLRNEVRVMSGITWTPESGRLWPF